MKVRLADYLQEVLCSNSPGKVWHLDNNIHHMPRFCHYLLCCKKSMIMSDLLNDSVIEGLWHVLQELLLLDRLHVGALHLQQYASLLLLLVLNNFVTLPFWSWQRGQTPVNEILFTSSDIQSHAIAVVFGIKRKVAHPEILDDGSDDHPGPAAATGAVHQTVATLINNRFTHAGGSRHMEWQDWDIGSLSVTLSDGQHCHDMTRMCGLHKVSPGRGGRWGPRCSSPGPRWRWWSAFRWQQFWQNKERKEGSKGGLTRWESGNLGWLGCKQSNHILAWAAGLFVTFLDSDIPKVFSAILLGSVVNSQTTFLPEGLFVRCLDSDISWNSSWGKNLLLKRINSEIRLCVISPLSQHIIPILTKITCRSRGAPPSHCTSQTPPPRWGRRWPDISWSLSFCNFYHRHICCNSPPPQWGRRSPDNWHHLVFIFVAIFILCSRHTDNLTNYLLSSSSLLSSLSSSSSSYLLQFSQHADHHDLCCDF